MKLMQHIRQVDESQKTVVIVQVENEIGMLPEARDHSHLANEAFVKEVRQQKPVRRIMAMRITKVGISGLMRIATQYNALNCINTNKSEPGFGRIWEDLRDEDSEW